MRKIEVCLVCYSVYLDATLLMDMDSITRLMLTMKHFPDQFNMEKRVCPSCRVKISDEVAEKILKSERRIK